MNHGLSLRDLVLRRRSMRTAVLTLMACLAAVSALVAQTVKKPASPVVAVVSDSSGHATTVTNLRAIYAPDDGSGDRDGLVTYLPALRIRLTNREGRVRTFDTLNVPFTAIRRVSFPGYYKLEVERRDGTALVLEQLTGRNRGPDANYVLEERDATGGVTKSEKLDDYKFATEKQAGTVLGARVMRVLLLSGFAGVAKTSSGREGKFSINSEEVRSIEFK
jgi:hypothetical protein